MSKKILSLITFGLILPLVATLGLGGCAQLKKRQETGSGAGSPFEQMESGEKTPVPEPEQPKPLPESRPAKVKKVGLVLGPGGLKSFAHAAVIKELAQAKVPIDSVIGLEWGALIGALYAHKGQVHEPEWQAHKLRAEDLPGKSMFGSDLKPQSINHLTNFLKKNFGSEYVQKSKIEFTCPSLSLRSGNVRWQQKGRFIDALKKCLPFPPYYQSDDPWLAAPFEVSEAVSYLKRRDINIVIFVDVLGADGPLFESGSNYKDHSEALVLWHQLRRQIQRDKQVADHVIQVKTRSFRLFDLDSRKALLAAGKSAGRDMAIELVKAYGF